MKDLFLETGQTYLGDFMLRKLIFLTIIFLMFHSCSIDTSRIAPGYVEAFRAIKNILIAQENKLITPEIIDRIPYASMTLRIGRGAPGLVILESYQDEKETWVSADGIYLVIHQGRVVKTGGLLNNLVDFRAVDNDFENLIKHKDSEKLFYYYSYDKPELINMRVEANRKFIRKERIDLINSSKQLNLIEEKITNDFIGWSEVNRYLVDDDNFVWKSEQYISPKLPGFHIEVTKKLVQ